MSRHFARLLNVCYVHDRTFVNAIGKSASGQWRKYACAQWESEISDLPSWKRADDASPI